MSVARLLSALSLSLTGSVLGLAQARADVPVIDESILTGPCGEARVLDNCPACTCGMLTSTSSIQAQEASTIPLGIVVKLEGKRSDGVDYAAIHMLLGDDKKLKHVGRLAESYLDDGSDTFKQFDVIAFTQEFHMCPGMCDWNPVGLIHPLEVKITESKQDMTTFEESRAEQTLLVLCYAMADRPICYATPIAGEAKVQTIPGAPNDKVKVRSRDGFKRSWKLGFKGELKLGAVTGKLAKMLKQPKAVSVQVSDLPNFPDAEQLR
jgi:hypothetical protein